MRTSTGGTTPSMPGRASERADRAEEGKQHGERGKRKRKIRYTDESDTSYAVTPAHASFRQRGVGLSPKEAVHSARALSV